RIYPTKDPTSAETVAAFGLSKYAITGTKTRLSEMNPAPPMKLLIGIVDATTKSAERPAIFESSFVSSLNPNCIVSTAPNSGVYFRTRNGWEHPLTRVTQNRFALVVKLNCAL